MYKPVAYGYAGCLSRFNLPDERGNLHEVGACANDKVEKHRRVLGSKGLRYEGQKGGLLTEEEAEFQVYETIVPGGIEAGIIKDIPVYLG